MLRPRPRPDRSHRQRPLRALPAAAEDLVQEALIKVAQRWPRLRDGDPTAYARRILHRDHISWWRRRRAHLGVRPWTESSDAGPDIPQRLVIVAALQELPPRQRAVIVLRYFEDLTERATAEVLGVSVGTVKSQASDALRRLRAHAALAELIGKEI